VSEMAMLRQLAARGTTLNCAFPRADTFMTKDEKMGLQFGETLRVTRKGCESLNAYPRQWIICQT